MACLLPIIPYDLKWSIAKMKYDLETKSYAAFFEDFIVEVIGYQEDMAEYEEILYSPIVSDIYNLRITYKPTGSFIVKRFVLKRCASTLPFDKNTIKKFSIKDIHYTTRRFVKGEWKCITDSYGSWYYSNKFNCGVVLEETYQEWKVLTKDLQSVMMNRFDRFIEVD